MPSSGSARVRALELVGIGQHLADSHLAEFIELEQHVRQQNTTTLAFRNLPCPFGFAASPCGDPRRLLVDERPAPFICLRFQALPLDAFEILQLCALNGTQLAAYSARVQCRPVCRDWPALLLILGKRPDNQRGPLEHQPFA